MAIRFFFLILFSVCNFIFPQTGVDTTTALNDTINSFIVDSAAVSDTTGLLSTEKNIAKVDTVIPIYQNPFYSYSNFISHKEILKMNYRYTGDLLRPANFYFEKDLGRVGQNNEIIFYGTGFGGISYFTDGILSNSRLSNSLNINLIQSEYIDSIEIIPSPRGFLYSPFNNPISINFISKDFISVTPYSRIKYYEGPDGEAMFDGMFNSILFKDFNLFFEVTNRKTDSLYRNTNFGIWQANLKLKYLLSNSVNLIGSYSLDDYNAGLFGGADADSILKIVNDIDDYLASTVSPVEVPVNFLFRKEEVLTHNFNLRLLGNLFENSHSDFNIYYKYYENKIIDVSTLDIQSKSKTFGTHLRQKFSLNIFDFDLIGNYEQNKFPYLSDFKMDNYSFAPIVSIKLFNDKFIPSFFYKYTGLNISSAGSGTKNNFSGMGFDLYYQPHQQISAYLGYSMYENPGSESNVKNIEAGIKTSYKNLLLNLKYFRRENFVNNYAGIFIDSSYNNPADISGISADVDFNIWNFFLETQTSYYINPEGSDNLFFKVPQIVFNGGLYYKDILFDENLDLKTGFVFNYAGKRNFLTSYLTNVEPYYRIDFMVAGEIQNSAIVYFTWENLTDNIYYIDPFYPMPERSIRFGVAWEIFN